MTIFMLHFDCKPNRPDTHGQHTTADACVIGASLEEAEILAREAIQTHDYRAEGLIAYSRIEKSHVVDMDEFETVLYLKAMQQSPAVSVMFT